MISCWRKTTTDDDSLAGAFARAREGLDNTQDLGEAYRAVDALSEGVRASFPASLCRAGCANCCYLPTALFTTDERQWGLVEKHLREEWSQERREALLARFRSRYPRWRLWVLYLTEGRPTVLIFFAAWIAKWNLCCPFLEDSRCSIYAVRPLPCRTFGHFAMRSWPWRTPRIYACEEQGELLQELTTREGIQLPLLNTLMRRMRRLLGRREKLLVRWLEGSFPRGRAAKKDQRADAALPRAH